jgi:hypothetical protein
MDASVPSPTTDAPVDVACSLGAPYTHVCITLDRFNIVISLFYEILKFFICSCVSTGFGTRGLSILDGQVTNVTGIMCKVKYPIIIKLFVFMFLNFTIYRRATAEHRPFV